MQKMIAEVSVSRFVPEIRTANNNHVNIFNKKETIHKQLSQKAPTYPKHPPKMKGIPLQTSGKGVLEFSPSDKVVRIFMHISFIYYTY